MSRPEVSGIANDFARGETNASSTAAFRRELVHNVREGVLHFMKYCSAPLKVRREVLDGITALFNDGLDGISLVKVAKWLFCYPLARFNQETISDQPGNPFRISKVVKCWFRSRMYKDAKGENAHLWYTWFQLKRICPHVPEDFIVQAAKDHRSSMARKEPQDPDEESDRGEVFELLKRRVFPTLKRAMDHGGWDFRQHAWAPSLSACLEAGRERSAGYLERVTVDCKSAVGTVIREVGKGGWGDLVPLYRVTRHADENWFGPLDPPAVLSRSETGEGDPLWAWALLDGTPTRVPVFETGTEDKLAWHEFLEDLAWRETLEPRLRCETEFILEPLKVRTITKGPAASYTLAKAWQKAIHGIMREMPVFKLIGAVISAEDVEGIRLDPGWVWHSIDYSAATDRLSASLSERCMEELTSACGVLPIGDAIRATLRPHTVGYTCLKRRYGVSLPDVEQENGQLMGSPTSFPILCLVNYGTILAADEEFFGAEGWSPAQIAEVSSRALINGDDALVHRPREWRVVHERISAACGLSYSVGKAYSSTRYANMNSVGFWDIIPPGSRASSAVSVSAKPRMTVCTYYPIASLLGMCSEKTVGRENDDVIIDGRCVDALKRGIEASLRPAWTVVMALGREEFASSLRREIEWRNLFVSEALGGCGVPCPRGYRYRIEERQKGHAEWVWTSGGHFLSDEAGRPDLLLEPLSENDVLGPCVINDRRFLREPRSDLELRKLRAHRPPSNPRKLPKGWAAKVYRWSIPEDCSCETCELDRLRNELSP